jgi:hypothetical protein
MYFRPATLAVFTSLLLALGIGCKKNGSPVTSAPPTSLPLDTIASVHWLGKHQLGYEATAFFFMRIWNMPQSVQLERQTLNKLATTPGQWLPGGTNLTQDSVARLWSLLNDLVHEESYLEIRTATNSQPSIVFAIRLDEAQTGSWFINLSNVLQSLASARAVINPVDHSWSLKTTNVLNVISLIHVGEWTVVSAGLEQNKSAGEIAARIQRDGVPFVSAGTNLWFEASLDFPRLADAFSINSGGGQNKLRNFKHLNFSVSGDGANVITRGLLAFNHPFSAPLDSWQLPVELMHEPLTSFTSVRGLHPWLMSWKPWRDLEIGAAPDQLFLWSLAGSPYHIYLAAPVANVSKQVVTLTDNLLQKANPWLAANGYISFDRANDANGVTWGNLPDIKPFIKSAGPDNDGWIFAGLLPDTNTLTTVAPAGLIQDVLRRTNLVYYDWEVTGPRLQPVLQLGQTARQIARRPEMAMDSITINLLAALIPRLGTSATIINRTGLAEFTLYRRSTLGFNAVELHLLADWLESQQFPHDLHSMR